jgi:hypothetical protein
MTNTGTVRSNAHGSLVGRIVEKVAESEGVDPTELQPPLYEVIDPDALNAVFADAESGISRENGRIEFTYCGYEVVVRSDGQVSITEAEPSDRQMANRNSSE